MKALQAFEAAARHLNFTRAAVELNLTQTCDSHQIRNPRHSPASSSSCGRRAGCT